MLIFLAIKVTCLSLHWVSGVGFFLRLRFLGYDYAPVSWCALGVDARPGVVAPRSGLLLLWKEDVEWEMIDGWLRSAADLSERLVAGLILDSDGR